MKDKSMIKEQLMQLKANEQQLRAEIAERKKAEEALKTANQQLRASEQQLKAANQQLRASEQQLKAANQQLRASEQQLRASNQQLRASEQQLQAANQQLKANNLQLQREVTERKQAEEVLRDSEERFRAIFDNANDGILLADTETKKFHVGNNTACQMLGYSLEEIKNLGVTDIHPKEDLPYVIEQFQRQVRREIAVAKDLPVKRKDGSVFYADVNTSLVTLAGRTYLLGVFRDITERKLAEEALRESEERYRIQFEQTIDALFLADTQTGIILECNRAAMELIGREKSEMVGQHQRILHPSEEWDGKFSKSFKQHIIGEALVETKVIKKSGEIRDVAIKASTFDLKGKKVILAIFRDITERKKAEEDIKKQNEFAETVINSLQYPFYVIGTDYTIILSNKAAKEKGVVEGGRCYQLTHRCQEPCSGEHVCPLKEVIRTGKPTVTEHIHFDNYGNCRNFEVHGDPILDKDGQVIQMIEYSIDITERKKTEVELYRVNRALRVISECNQVLVRVTNEPNLLNEICRNLVGVGGYRLAWIGLAQQDEGKTVHPVAQAGYEEEYLENLNITWSDTERSQGPTGTAIRTGNVYISRNILTDPKFEPWRAEAKKRGYVSYIVIPLIAENRTLGVLNIYASEPDAFDKEEVNLLSELANDLAFGIVALRTRVEREQTQETLKKLSSAVEQTADIVIITNKDGVIEYINPAFEKVTGYVEEEVIGQTPRVLKSGKHDQKFYETLWKIILSGNVFRDTLINRKKNGEFYYAEKTITPIRGAEGNITHFVSTDKDVTERKEIEKTQRLAQLGELVADMAHEVNNPLMIISGNAQLCLMEEIQSEIVKNNLKVIFEECRRAKDIIHRLLKFSRPSKGEIKEIDVNKNIEAVVGIVEHQFKLANIEIKRNYPESSFFILADEQQMQEVFMNLLNNAKEAMPQGGVIEISTNLEREFMKIDFKDTGCGMSEEVKKRIFEPFFTTKEEGTGLGLSVCYGIIKSHNGELRFESELGKGTTATILLPLGGGKG